MPKPPHALQMNAEHSKPHSARCYVPQQSEVRLFVEQKSTKLVNLGRIVPSGKEQKSVIP